MIVHAIQALLTAAAALLAGAAALFYRRKGERPSTTPAAVATGAVTNFFDTLGIGSFAPTTAIIKFLTLTRDELIPGSLNAGHAIPTITQALIYIALIKVDLELLVACIGASMVGALVGAGVVARLPETRIRIGMGVALLVAAALFVMRNLGLMPGGGDAITLGAGAFVIAAIAHLAFGALMTLGIGLYAPSLMVLSLLGMDPRAAFPIMMGSCAFLMPAASLRFISAGRFDPKLALGLTLGGVPAVIIAAYIVKEMPLDMLRWLVTVVVLVAGGQMLHAAFSERRRAKG